MIILDNVSKHYQTRDKPRFAAVEPTSLKIQDGEIFGLMGYSGAGKSTLLRLINLLERPDSGKVNVCGQELTALDAAALRQARQNIGMVFQQFNLLSNRTVADNVAFPLEIAGWSSEKIKERVKECLEIVGLTERADHYPAQLSGGERQRITIARAILKDASIVILDEATAYADPENEALVERALSKLVAGKTLVTIAHRLSTITGADQILVMDGGRIVARGRHGELLKTCPLYARMWKEHMSSTVNAEEEPSCLQ